MLGCERTPSYSSPLPASALRTQALLDQLADLKAFAEPLFAKMKDIAEKDVPELNKALAAKGVPYIK